MKSGEQSVMIDITCLQSESNVLGGYGACFFIIFGFISETQFSKVSEVNSRQDWSDSPIDLKYPKTFVISSSGKYGNKPLTIVA